MSLFRSDLRPPATLSDEAVERYVAALRAQLEPDPLFRHRLRGEVMNRYVATREGLRTDGAVPRQMGRLGRAVLYASFALALSVSGVMAASQETVPGDALYVLKRHIESLRMQVVPAHLEDDLAAYMLAERIQELGILADLGDRDAVTALAVEIEDGWAAFSAGLGSAEGTAGALYLEALHRLVAQLPSDARAELGRALATAPALPGGHDGSARAIARAGGGGVQATSGADNEAGRDGARHGAARSGTGDPARSGDGDGQGGHGAGGTNVGTHEGGTNDGTHEGGTNDGGEGREGAAGPTAAPRAAGGRAPTGPVSGPGGGRPTGRPSAQPSPAPASTPRPSPRGNEERVAPAMPEPRSTPGSGPASDD